MTDERVAFVLRGYHDAHLAGACLTFLRRAYRSCTVHLISDGDDDPAWGELASRFSCNMVYGRRLHLLAEGGAIWTRTLRVFLSAPADYLVKIDTDTRIWRQFTVEPAYDVSGTVAATPDAPPHVQGGCVILRRTAVERLLDLGIFDDPRWTDPRSITDSTALQRILTETGRQNEDRLGCRAFQMAGLTVGDHPEVQSRWLEPKRLEAWHRATGELRLIRNESLQYAATHPHKWLDVELKDADSRPSAS